MVAHIADNMDPDQTAHLGAVLPGSIVFVSLVKVVLSAFEYTVKPVNNGHSEIDKTKIFMTNCSLMKVKSIAECSPWSILQYF